MQDFQKFTLNEFENLYFEKHTNYSCEKGFARDNEGNLIEKIYLDLIFRTVEQEIFTQKICVPIKVKTEKGISSFSFNFKEIDFCCNLNFSIEEEILKFSELDCKKLFIEKLMSFDKTEEGYLSSIFMSVLIDSKAAAVARKIKREIKNYSENPFVFMKI